MAHLRIIIPCFNEAACIATVLAELRDQQREAEILVIDDASADKTASLAESAEKTTVISLPINLGVGGAVQTGLIYSYSAGDSFAVKFDGDGQHNPAEISNLLAPLQANQADIVVGSRFLAAGEGYQSSFIRRIGIKFFEAVCFFLTGQRITDPTSGFRAYNSQAIGFMARHYPSFDYPEPEEIILAHKNSLRVLEIPTTMRERKSGLSSISSAMSVYYMIKVTLAMLLISLRPPYPKETDSSNV